MRVGTLADSLYQQIPAGVGSQGKRALDLAEMEAMLAGGACWAMDRGYGRAEDLERIEEAGVMAGADPAAGARLVAPAPGDGDVRLRQPLPGDAVSGGDR